MLFFTFDSPFKFLTLDTFFLFVTVQSPKASSFAFLLSDNFSFLHNCFCLLNHLPNLWPFCGGNFPWWFSTYCFNNLYFSSHSSSFFMASQLINQFPNSSSFSFLSLLNPSFLYACFWLLNQLPIIGSWWGGNCPLWLSIYCFNSSYFSLHCSPCLPFNQSPNASNFIFRLSLNSLFLYNCFWWINHVPISGSCSTGNFSLWLSTYSFNNSYFWSHCSSSFWFL